MGVDELDDGRGNLAVHRLVEDVVVESVKPFELQRFYLLGVCLDPADGSDHVGGAVQCERRHRQLRELRAESVPRPVQLPGEWGAVGVDERQRIVRQGVRAPEMTPAR